MARRRDVLLGMGATFGLASLGCGDTSTDAADSGTADGTVGGTDSGPSIDATTGDGGNLCTPTQSDAQGPFFEEGAPTRTMIAAPEEPGARLRVSCTVVNTDCTTPIVGAVLDIWQADRDGNYHDAGQEYRLRGRVTTDADGRFAIDTIVPGNYGQPDGSMRPAHLHVKASIPGFAPLTTQIYFAGDPFLSPNDGCTGCGSDDTERIMTLTGDEGAGFDGELRIVLAAA